MKKETMENLRNEKIMVLEKELELVKSSMEEFLLKEFNRSTDMYDKDFAVKAEVREILTVIKTGVTDPYQVLLELKAQGVM